MQRILFALIALVSFLAVNLRPAQSQGAPGEANEPTKPQQIDHHPVLHSEEPSNREGAKNGPSTGSFSSPVDTKIAPVIVPADTTVSSVEVENRPLIVAGHVKGDIRAKNSEVTFRPGATIDGKIYLSNTRGATSLFNTMPQTNAIANNLQPNREQSHWFGSQFMLWLVGLLGGLILLLIAPRATTQVSETVSLSPGRCLAVGGVSLILMIALLAFSGGIMALHGVVKTLWSPVNALLAISSLLLLAYGWLAGMRVAGDRIARRFGFPGSGPLYWRLFLGLTVFFLANAILGGIFTPIGIVGLLLEFTVALMGLGAVVLTGLGNDPDWLARRMRGEAYWFSSRPKI